MTVAAVIFDLDGVLVDSETVWDDARRAVVAHAGRPWPPDATRAMMGMSAPEWSRYLHDVLGVPVPPDEISKAVVEVVEQAYDQHLSLLPSARETVRTLAAKWPLGLASSSNRPVIELFLDKSGLRAAFIITVSSEEVAHGKPAPDVYLAAARGLGAAPEGCVAIEDSSNGIRAAASAGMPVIAVPNTHFPPDRDALDLAASVIDSLRDLTPARVSAAGKD